jgi:hypothetical protein
MKTALTLSTLAVLSVISTASFAQNFVTYSAAYGNANATVATVAPAVGRFTAADWGYAPRQHRAQAASGR